MLLETLSEVPFFPIATRFEAALEGIAVPITRARATIANVEIFNMCEFIFFIG
jgi:hypothetical protein